MTSPKLDPDRIAARALAFFAVLALLGGPVVETCRGLSALPALLEVAAGDGAAAAKMAEKLKEAGDPRLKGVLRARLERRPMDLGREGIQILGDLRDPEAYELLLDVALTDQPPSGRVAGALWGFIRRDALAGLVQLGRAEAVPELAPLIRTDSDALMRIAVAESLGPLGGADALPALKALVEDPQTHLAIRVGGMRGWVGAIRDSSNLEVLRYVEKLEPGRLRDAGLKAISPALTEVELPLLRKVVMGSPEPLRSGSRLAAGDVQVVRELGGLAGASAAVDEALAMLVTTRPRLDPVRRRRVESRICTLVGHRGDNSSVAVAVQQRRDAAIAAAVEEACGVSWSG